MTENKREVRIAVEAWPLADLEIRAGSDGMSFRGYAAVFNSWSEDLGGFREMIAPDAFTRTLKRDRNIRMFLNHNTDSLLATTKADTLSLRTDEKGLLAEAKLPDTTLGRDTAELLRRGDIDSMSFGFSTVRDSWDENQTQRTLLEVRLWEVSPVTGWPAYRATSAGVRHLADELGEDPEPLEAALRVLLSDDRLTREQGDLLLAAINARTDSPVISASVAAWRERLAAKRIA